MKKLKHQTTFKYNRIFYQAAVAICKFHSGGYANVALSIIPTLALYLLIFYVAPIILGYEPFNAPVILKILGLATCLGFFFFVGAVIRMVFANAQKFFESKLNQSTNK